MSHNWPKIVLFGDSIVQRAFDGDSPWAARLAFRFGRVADLIIRGFSGYHSRSALKVLPELFNSESILNVVAFVIFLGTNDALSEETAPKFHVPVEEYSKNLERMIKYLESIGLKKDKIVLVTPGPYDVKKYLEWYPEVEICPLTDEKNVFEYAKACVSVAKKHNLDSINLYERMKRNESWSDYLDDGLHFSSQGGALIYKLLNPILERKVGSTRMLMPDWPEINTQTDDLDLSQFE